LVTPPDSFLSVFSTAGGVIAASCANTGCALPTGEASTTDANVAAIALRTCALSPPSASITGLGPLRAGAERSFGPAIDTGAVKAAASGAAHVAIAANAGKHRRMLFFFRSFVSRIIP
jgi:hypothetical protein